MQFVRRMMLTAALFGCASVAVGSPPTNATTQDAPSSPSRANSATAQGQAATGRTPSTSSTSNSSGRNPSIGDWILSELRSFEPLNQSTERIRVIGLQPAIIASPAATANSKNTPTCQRCDHAVVRGHGPESTQAVKPAVAIQVSEPNRQASGNMGCIDLTFGNLFQDFVKMMRDDTTAQRVCNQIPCPNIQAWVLGKNPGLREQSDAKAVTVVRVPGVPHTTILPPPPPFPIVREMMPIVPPAVAMPMHHRIVPIGTPAKHVHLATPDLEAHCERMTHRGDVVILEGDVKLHCKKHGQNIRIEAQRVILNMKDGTFTVESDAASVRATARMAMPPMTEMRQMQWMPIYPGMPMMPPPFPFPPFGPHPLQQIQSATPVFDAFREFRQMP